MSTAWLPVAVCMQIGCEAPAGGRWPREGVSDPDRARAPAAPVTTSDLRLDISTELQTYVLGEPVYLLLRLENTGATRSVFGSLDPSDGAVEVLVGGAEGAERRFGPLVETDQGPGIMVDLAAADSLGAVAQVFFGANGWTFPTPGTYTLTAVYRTPGTPQPLEARSAPITIEVRATADASGEFLTGDGNASAEAGRFLAWQAGDHLTEGRAHLEALLSRYPRSDLSHYVRSAFARSYSNRFMDYRTRQVRPPNCELALEQLSTVVEARLPPFVRAQNALIRARCAARGQDRAAAAAAILEARQITAGRVEYRGVLAQIEELERNLGAGPGRQVQ
jgi:hypothetical protein